MDNIYELLAGIPLFSGVTKETMTRMVGSTKFHFLKYQPGERMIEPGDPCTHIKFLISGTARVSIANADGRFTVSQTLVAPDVIAPEYVFGRHTNYPCLVTAIQPAGILQIDKSEYLKILNSDHIFLINYLNMLSTNAQKAVDGVLAVAAGSLEERIAFWIVALTQRGGTDIVLSCRHRDLYSLFGVQRSSFIATLDSMKQKGVIDYRQNEISVVDRRALIDMIQAKID